MRFLRTLLLIVGVSPQVSAVGASSSSFSSQLQGALTRTLQDRGGTQVKSMAEAEEYFPICNCGHLRNTFAKQCNHGDDGTFVFKNCSPPNPKVTTCSDAKDLFGERCPCAGIYDETDFGYRCGNGILENNNNCSPCAEKCDDGNQYNYDGCDEFCEIEDGFEADGTSGKVNKINYF